MKKVCKRMVKDYLDVVILFRLQCVQIGAGYDFMKYIQKRYHISISAGTVYSTLYALEREGYVKLERKTTKKLYSITPKGQALIRTFTRNLDFLTALAASLLSQQPRSNASTSDSESE